MKNKPLTLQANEFTNSIIELINSSNLPAYVLITELDKLLNTITRQEAQEIENYKNQIEDGEKDVQDNE